MKMYNSKLKIVHRIFNEFLVFLCLDIIKLHCTIKTLTVEYDLERKHLFFSSIYCSFTLDVHITTSISCFEGANMRKKLWQPIHRVVFHL